MEVVGTPIENELKQELRVLFKDDSESLSLVSNHEAGIAAYYKLKQNNYEEKELPSLLKEILSKYDRIQKINTITRMIQGKMRSPKTSIISLEDARLMQSIALTCRGSKRQCPVGMSEIFDRAGGLSLVYKVGEMIDEPLQHDSKSILKTTLENLKNNFGLSNEIITRSLNIWGMDKKEATIHSAAGLFHYTSGLMGYHIKVEDIAAAAAISAPPVRRHSKKIHMEQRDFLYGSNEIEKVSAELQKLCGGKIDIHEITKPEELEIHKKRLELVKYLLEHNRDEKNPVYYWTLEKKLKIPSYKDLQVILYASSLGPASLGFCESEDHLQYHLKSQKKQTAETYIEVMQKLLRIGYILNV